MYRSLILKACRKHPRLEELQASAGLLRAVEDMMRDTYHVLDSIDERLFSREAYRCFTAVLEIKDRTPSDLANYYDISIDQAMLLKESLK